MLVLNFAPGGLVLLKASYLRVTFARIDSTSMVDCMPVFRVHSRFNFEFQVGHPNYGTILITAQRCVLPVFFPVDLLLP